VIAYLDSSVLLREILEQDPKLAEWEVVIGVTSELTRLECLRTIDRVRLNPAMNAERLTKVTQHTETILGRMDLLQLTPGVLSLAASPFTIPVRTLDAIHLASAMLYRSSQPDDERPIYFATFDKELADAARAVNFDVLGA